MRTVGKGGPGIPLGPDGRAPDVQDEKRVGKFPALWWVMWKGVGMGTETKQICNKIK